MPDKNDIYQAALQILREKLDGCAVIDHFKVEVEHDQVDIVPQRGAQLSLARTEPTSFKVTITALSPWGQQMLRQANLTGNLSITTY